MEKGKLTYADLSEIYNKLSADLPIEGAERASKDITRKGYDTTGYGYQFHVNRMNEVLFGHWRALYTVINESPKGKMTQIVIHMIVQIGNWVVIDGKSEFEVLMQVEGYGDHASTDIGSAYKGAYTNAFKKATAMLGVGKKAFEGTLDEDMRAYELEKNKEEESGKDNNRKRFFALCNERKISEKVQKLIVEFYTEKQSRKDVTEEEFKSINKELPTLEKAALLEMAKTVQERKESKDKQAS